MSATSVQNAIVSTFQKHATCITEFAYALSGTVALDGQDDKKVLGTDTHFTTEVKVGDLIGNSTAGFRKVLTITDDTTLTVKSEFDAALTGTAYLQYVRLGLPKINDIADRGKTMGIVYVKDQDISFDLPGTRTKTMYGFVLFVAFYEMDDEEVENRKSFYSKMLHDIVDEQPSFGHGDILGNTSIDEFHVAEAPELAGLYYGISPLVVTVMETRGNR